MCRGGNGSEIVSCPELQRTESFLKGTRVSYFSHPNRSASSFTLGQEPLPNPCLEPDLSFTSWSWDHLISAFPLSSAFQEEMVHYTQNLGAAGKEDVCTNIDREDYMYSSAGLSVDIGQPSFPNRRAYREKAEITSPFSCNWIELSSHRTTNHLPQIQINARASLLPLFHEMSLAKSTGGEAPLKVNS